jgi:hypothetical protein
MAVSDLAAIKQRRTGHNKAAVLHDAKRRQNLFHVPGWFRNRRAMFLKSYAVRPKQMMGSIRHLRRSKSAY